MSELKFTGTWGQVCRIKTTNTFQRFEQTSKYLTNIVLQFVEMMMIKCYFLSSEKNHKRITKIIINSTDVKYVPVFVGNN